MAVEDRQERDRHQRGRDEPGRGAVEPLAHGEEQAGGDDARKARDHAADQVESLGIAPEALDDLLAAAERPDRAVADRVDRVQQVRVRGRVEEVVRVVVPVEEPDRRPHEVDAFVDVVDGGKAVARAP